MNYFNPLRRSKFLATAALSLSLLLGSSFASYAAPAASVVATKEISSSEYAAFLKDKFGVTLSKNVTRGEFFLNLVRSIKLTPTDQAVNFKDINSSSPYYTAAKTLYQHGILDSTSVNASGSLGAIHAVQLAVRAADLRELAYTYPKAKAEKTVSKLPVKASSLNLAAIQELAAAVDTGLLPAAYYKELKQGASLSKDLANVLIGKTLEFRGQFKQFLGYTGDPDIFAKLTDAYHQSTIIKSDNLQTIVDAALEQGLITGYNLKDSRYESNFVASLSLVYGHSDLKHALQLIGLLRSEGIEAKVQFEPKTSAFVYLKEWGDPGVSDQYEVRQIANGNYIEYAKEYDLAFEFNTAADKQAFNAIIHKYAKKDKDGQSGLLAGSWWQPLYYSLTELKDYSVITNNKIQTGRYYAQSFSLKEQSAAVIAGFKQVDPSVTVQHYDFWADAPFFRYLNGESS